MSICTYLFRKSAAVFAFLTMLYLSLQTSHGTLCIAIGTLVRRGLPVRIDHKIFQQNLFSIFDNPWFKQKVF